MAQVTERLEGMDVWIYHGQIYIPNTYSAGAVGSRFLTELRDRKRIMGTRCPACNRVYVPARSVCKDCFSQLDEWVEVSDKGTVLSYSVCHQPNPTFPVRAATALGFKPEQYMPGLQVSKFGNTYSGSSPIGLAAILDQAEPHKRIMIVSYGSGAGSDAYLFVTTNQIRDKREKQKFTVKYQAENKFIEYVDYATYRRFKEGL